MDSFTSMLLRASHRPLVTAWVLFFTFAVVASLMLQLVVLPFWFPALHAGDGLLVGGDWVGFHRIGAALSEKIRSQGWAAWELSPFGQPPAGIAAALYALTVPKPYVLIPLNAALHATAGVVLVQIARLLTGDIRCAVFAALPFVLFPSAMAWYAQVQKDGFYFAGAFLCLYGWIVLARLTTWQAGVRPILAGFLWFGLGLALMASVRIYAFQLVQGISIVLAAGLIALFVVRGMRGSLLWGRCVLAIAGFLLIPILLKFAPVETRGTPEVPQIASKIEDDSHRAPVVVVDGQFWHGAVFASEKWKESGWLPRFVENSFLKIAVLRHGYFVTPGYDGSGSMIDRDVELLSVKDFLTYLPRALQLGLFAPFPSDWASPAQSSGGGIMRRVAGVEMLVVYVALAFLPYALWHWRRRVEMWLTASFASIFLLLYSYATPNIGSLYRLRYGFLMLLVSLGVAAAFTALRDFRNSPLHSPPKGQLP